MIDPDVVGAAARRMAAHLVADQANFVQVSLTGMPGPAFSPEEAMDHPSTALVVVARGPGIKVLLAQLEPCLKHPDKPNRGAEDVRR